ncbi:MAG TPA: ribosomal protein S18-alanine N-acetyltransferase [Ottowia sp.]|uniref:ribosomal protein S18-alanine N-acetyltransferase n=1 Tax=Ottowia sp. TaxID=1898956 RepID=UPI002C88A604|nr:ribosomal protein S18-alanine N-acetyltransferase [Ottowia sp.]HMN21668.1 ribosomal protein S18-alanine N-acetyltransferase [Ottowia sp.]
MSAIPGTPACASPLTMLEARFEPMTLERLDAVLAVEQSAYSHPWSRGNLRDSIQAGHQAQCLLAGDELLGYFIALAGFREVHLLNITVAPAHQRQGWALVLLDALALWARGQQAEWLWLEVRASNSRAQQIYQRRGFAQVGLRKGYYPLGHGVREDAVVMNLRLAEAGG